MKLFQVCAMTAGLLLSWSAMSEPLRIQTIQGPPWGFVGSDGKPTGMMYEIGNRIAEEAGFSYTNALVPYARTALEIETGGADCILRFSNEHMARVAVPVASVATMPVILVGPSGTRYNNLAELRGKTVGVVRTSNYVEQFDSDRSIQKYPVNDYVTMAKMLAMRRLDAGVGSSVGLFYGAYMAGVKPEELGVPLVLGSNDFILFLSKKSAKPETIRALKGSVRKLTASGEIKKIMGKYTSFDVELPQK
ncbi:substrate-binding periplasmic protein [Duganella hordei]|uniref:substrate-binding periplasmic protein n=1 Tax=Duganella hordei TaxID=2865934 RepID=UPI00159DC2F5